MASKFESQFDLEFLARVACAAPFVASPDEVMSVVDDDPPPMSLPRVSKHSPFFATIKAVAKRQATRLTLSLAILTVATTFGCSYIDPYAAKWDAIKVGDSRSIAVEALGSPSVVNSVELSVLKAEQLAWRAPLGGRTYIMVTAMDRVVAKSVIN